MVDQQRVKGPILVTHTKNDKAVGVAYPLASRISGDKTAAFGDENDKFGGLGRNGAQQMQTGEVVSANCWPPAATTRFIPASSSISKPARSSKATAMWREKKSPTPCGKAIAWLNYSARRLPAQVR